MIPVERVTPPEQGRRAGFHGFPRCARLLLGRFRARSRRAVADMQQVGHEPAGRGRRNYAAASPCLPGLVSILARRDRWRSNRPASASQDCALSCVTLGLSIRTSLCQASLCQGEPVTGTSAGRLRTPGIHRASSRTAPVSRGSGGSVANRVDPNPIGTAMNRRGWWTALQPRDFCAASGRSKCQVRTSADH